LKTKVRKINFGDRSQRFYATILIWQKNAANYYRATSGLHRKQGNKSTVRVCADGKIGQENIQG
jgi:hypothetical protein